MIFLKYNWEFALMPKFIKNTLIIFSIFSLALLQTFSNFAYAASDSSTINLTVGVSSDFSASPLSGTAPLAVNFTNNSNAGSGSSYAWSFGDGGSSTDENPTYTYNNAGSYSVSLTVTQGSSSDTKTKVDYITVSAGGGAGPVLTPDPPIISNVQIISDYNAATILWETNKPATTEIKWGKTEEYEMGKLFSQPADLIIEHRINLENLISGLTYHFIILARSADGGETISKDYSFTTPVKDVIPPANVSDFKAIGGDGEISLTWLNPAEDDFAGVSIMRSLDFFPLFPDQGEKVYEGKGEQFIDTGLENGRRYYYTAFSYDRSGNFSSGALATDFPWSTEGPAIPEIPPIIPPEMPIPPEFPPEWIPVEPGQPIEEPIKPIEELTINDIDFFQDGKRIYPDKQGKIKVSVGLPIEVYLSAEKVPYVLKTIILNIALPQSKNSQQAASMESLTESNSAAYLLKINDQKTAYQTTIQAPAKSGNYDLSLMILDYWKGKIAKIDGQLIVRRYISPLHFREIPGIYALIIFLVGSFLTIFIVSLISKKRKRYQALNELSN